MAEKGSSLPSYYTTLSEKDSILSPTLITSYSHQLKQTLSFDQLIERAHQPLTINERFAVYLLMVHDPTISTNLLSEIVTFIEQGYDHYNSLYMKSYKNTPSFTSCGSSSFRRYDGFDERENSFFFAVEASTLESTEFLNISPHPYQFRHFLALINQIFRHPRLSLQDLNRLLHHPFIKKYVTYYFLHSILENPQLPSDDIEKLRRVYYREKKSAGLPSRLIAAHPNTSGSLLREMRYLKDELTVAALVSRRDTLPQNLQEAISTDSKFSYLIHSAMSGKPFDFQ